MTSKYQKNLFPVEKVVRMKTIVVETQNEETYQIPYNLLKKEVINGQIVFRYTDIDRDMILPICRISTLDKLEAKDAAQPIRREGEGSS